MKKIVIIVFIAFVTTVLSANFIRLNRGSRAMGMGNAHVAAVDDPTAIFWNPARLYTIQQFTISASHQNLYGINDFYNEMVALAFPLPYAKIGFGWTQLNLLDVYSEQIVYLSASSVIWLQQTPIHFGINTKHLHAKVSDYSEADSPSNFDFDVGINTILSSRLNLGFMVKNITEPSFTFLSHKESIDRHYTAGLAYRWVQSFLFSCDYEWNKNEGNLNIGGELWFFDVFAPRIGMNGENFTAGFGLRNNQWQLDGAILSQENLGSTYRISFMWKFDFLKQQK